MKFYIRRAVVGIISLPLVAGAYLFLNVLLIALGADAQYSVEDAFYNGIEIGIVSAVMFTFSPQVSRLLNRITGE